MIGQRGVAMYKDRLYFGTPDAHLICLDARNGKQVWDLEIADYKFGYYISVTPVVVKDRLITGMSNDQSDIPGFLEARSPQDGKVLWHLNTGGLITASPITYTVEGKQYVAIASYSNVIAFGLPD